MPICSTKIDLIIVQMVQHSERYWIRHYFSTCISLPQVFYFTTHLNNLILWFVLASADDVDFGLIEVCFHSLFHFLNKKDFSKQELIII